MAATASFTLTNTASTPAIITATAGTPQSAATGTAFATTLQATVKDASGNLWAISTHKEDVSPEEMAKRIAQMAGPTKS